MINSMQMPKQGLVGDEYLASLFESLTLDNLRLLLATLWDSEEDVPSSRSRSDAIKHIYASAGGVPGKIVAAALDVESRSAMKHCFVGRVRNVQNIATLAAAPLWSEMPFNGIDSRVSFVKKAPNDITICFEHFVVSKEWRQIDEGTKIIDERLVRHVLVVRIDKRAEVATISYPGFSQGSATKVSERITYESLISSFLSYLLSKFQISVAALPMHDAIQALQDAESTRLRVVSAEVEARFGRVSLSTADDNNSVQSMLADMFKGHAKLSAKDLEDLVNTALRDTSANTIIALWKPENVLTRIKFWDVGAEFLFIWNGQNPSLDASTGIVKLLSDIARGISRKGSRDAWAVIAETAAGAVLTPRVLAERSSSITEEASKILLEAARAVLVEPVFRIKSSELLPTLGNMWTRDLAGLTRIHTADNGAVIDGRDPKNIEVGFRRISKEVAE